MATLAEIKTRIATEMVRRDLLTTLSAQLLLHIQRACEYYGGQRFWFNAAEDWAPTVPGIATIDIPASLRRVERVTIPAQGVEVQEYTLGQLEPATGSQSGIPTRYSYLNDQLLFDPIPDAVYTVRLTGLARYAKLTADGDSNVWTNEAEDLIVARARFTLARDQLRDAAGAQMAVGALQEALAQLKSETAKRLKTPRRVEARGARPFNIYTG